MPRSIHPADPAVPRPSPAPRLRRRAVLGGAAGGVLAFAGAGCGPVGDDPPAAGDPDTLAPVLAATLGLIGAYQATLVAQPGLADRLDPLLADHTVHVTALLTAMGRPTAPPPSPTGAPAGGVPAGPTAALASLRASEQAAQAAATSACVSAPAGHAALLGSIAACRATHVEALA